MSGERSYRSYRSDSIESSTEDMAAKLREYDRLSTLARKKSKEAAHVGTSKNDLS
jgi:hypothetical protein